MKGESMPKKVRKTRTNIQAMTMFTNREKPREVFWNTYHKYVDALSVGDEEDIRLITYYGLGGIGKSTLLKKLIMEIKEYQKSHDTSIQYALVDFRNNQNTVDVLKELRNELVEKYHIKFPMFDLALQVFRFKKSKDEDIDVSKITEDNIYLSSFLDIVSLIPFASPAVTGIKLIDQVFSHYRKKFSDRKIELNELQEDTADDILDKLPLFFADDLAKHTQDLKEPMVIFFDTYEALVNELEGVGSPLSKDLWIRGDHGLVINIPNVIWVIAGREKIKWADSDPEWIENLDQHLLGGLSEVDTKYFLNRFNITNESIIKDIYDVSEGVPVYLDLCVANYHNAINLGETVSIESIGRTNEEIVARMVKYMSDDSKDLFYLLSCLESWTEDELVKIAEEVLSNISSEAISRVKDYSFITSEDGDQYTMHKIIQGILFNKCNTIIKDKALRYYRKIMPEILENMSGTHHDYYRIVKKYINIELSMIQDADQLMTFYQLVANKFIPEIRRGYGYNDISSIIELFLYVIKSLEQSEAFEAIYFDYATALMNKRQYESLVGFYEEDCGEIKDKDKAFKIQEMYHLANLYIKQNAKRKQYASKKVFRLNESPSLSEMVDKGLLDSVELRMPVKEDIFQEIPFDQVGEYGGIITYPWKGYENMWHLGKFTEESLFRFKQDGSTVEANVAKGYEVDENFSEYRIYLRRGMRWSDGMPFTADDVLFYWEELALKNIKPTDLTECFYAYNEDSQKKELMTVEKVTDYEVLIKHAGPNIRFLERLAVEQKWFFAPKHYYKPFIEENPEFCLHEKGEYFGKCDSMHFWHTANRPTLRPWVATTSPDAKLLVMNRNPYYWKTDTEGNQLPYIDAIHCPLVKNNDEIIGCAKDGLTTIGFIDYGEREAVVKELDESKYTIYYWDNPTLAGDALQLNMSYEDEKYRTLFNNKLFRKALSHAIHRRVICSEIYRSALTPHQASIPVGINGYIDDWKSKWIEYDPNLSQQLLDDLGLRLEDGEKYRRFDNGEVFQLEILKVNGNRDKPQTFESILISGLESIGLKAVIKHMNRETYLKVRESNDYMCVSKPQKVFDITLKPECLVPVRTAAPWYGKYGEYYATKGESGIKPTGEIAQLLDYWENILKADSIPAYITNQDKIIQLHYENNWVIGYTSPRKIPVFFDKRLKNVPEAIVFIDEFRNFGHAKPYQFYFDNK